MLLLIAMGYKQYKQKRTNVYRKLNFQSVYNVSTHFNFRRIQMMLNYREYYLTKIHLPHIIDGNDIWI